MENGKQNLFCTEDGGPALAMAYVPMQTLGETYSPEEAITRGTLFPDLYKPFLGRTMNGGGRYE